jgi:hypothetical protein
MSNYTDELKASILDSQLGRIEKVRQVYTKRKLAKTKSSVQVWKADSNHPKRANGEILRGSLRPGYGTYSRPSQAVRPKKKLVIVIG